MLKAMHAAENNLHINQAVMLKTVSVYKCGVRFAQKDSCLGSLNVKEY